GAASPGSAPRTASCTSEGTTDGRARGERARTCAHQENRAHRWPALEGAVSVGEGVLPRRHALEEMQLSRFRASRRAVQTSFRRELHGCMGEADRLGRKYDRDVD